MEDLILSQLVALLFCVSIRARNPLVLNIDSNHIVLIKAVPLLFNCVVVWLISQSQRTDFSCQSISVCGVPQGCILGPILFPLVILCWWYVAVHMLKICDVQLCKYLSWPLSCLSQFFFCLLFVPFLGGISLALNYLLFGHLCLCVGVRALSRYEN